MCVCSLYPREVNKLGRLVKFSSLTVVLFYLETNPETQAKSGKSEQFSVFFVCLVFATQIYTSCIITDTVSVIQVLSLS